MQKLLSLPRKPSAAPKMAATAGSILLLPSPIDAARADNVIDRAISNAQPCQSLKFNPGITKTEVDKFESMDVKAAPIAIQGNAATMSLDAS
ncbi:hypothetical protein [Rhizobium sp. NXC24]|uniref:hypothetical protein n=1 Tax=Rhizobium sp. NXC24 TaxID=2048897 RepID=UPI00131A4B80|nr:hypothetical protein [Rhizobium sp. NXC24]